MGSTVFEEFCAALAGDKGQTVKLGEFTLDLALLNYAAWIRDHVVAPCVDDQTIEQAQSPHSLSPTANSRAVLRDVRPGEVLGRECLQPVAAVALPGLYRMGLLPGTGFLCSVS